MPISPQTTVASQVTPQAEDAFARPARGASATQAENPSAATAPFGQFLANLTPATSTQQDLTQQDLAQQNVAPPALPVDPLIAAAATSWPLSASPVGNFSGEGMESSAGGRASLSPAQLLATPSNLSRLESRTATKQDALPTDKLSRENAPPPPHLPPPVLAQPASSSLPEPWLAAGSRASLPWLPAGTSAAPSQPTLAEDRRGGFAEVQRDADPESPGLLTTVGAGPESVTAAESGKSERALVDQVLRQARFVLRRHANDVTFHLEPRELGAMTVTLRDDGSTVRLELIVESAATLELLQRNADDLQQRLRDAAFEGARSGDQQQGEVEVQVSLKQEQHSPETATRSQDAADLEPDSLDEPSAWAPQAEGIYL